MEEKLISFLEDLLGEVRSKDTKGNISFECPKKNHRKSMLVINIDKESNKFQNYHCWACGDSLKGQSLFRLLKTIRASDYYFKRLGKLIGKKKSNGDLKLFEEEIVDIKEILNLPRQFIPIYNAEKTHDYRIATNYLKKRKISKYEILKYNIGYCVKGRFSNRVIIPSYDDKGKLNYYIARDYFDNAKKKILNPKISKNVIFFDVFINWSEPINLVEGVFDAITVGINSIPILGKTLNSNLRQKIIKNHSDVNIILDNDAINDAYIIAENLMKNGIAVKIVELPKNKDPNSLGKSKTWKYIDESKIIDSNDLMKKTLFL